MNCEKCLALIDDFLDMNLGPVESAAVEAHLVHCQSCAVYQGDLLAIFESCHEVHEYLEEPPNSQALWLRISNLIESEQTALALAETKNVVNIAPKSFWARSLRLSFQQMAAAVIGIAVITSLLTIVGLQNAGNLPNSTAMQFWQVSPNAAQGFSATQRLEFENRLKQQQMAISYWNTRVEARKNQWNRDMREKFHRNLQVLDQVVADYTSQLQHNPEDKISEEMLDAALNDKMELLREFSEL